jgi:hypothetical protein
VDDHGALLPAKGLGDLMSELRAANPRGTRTISSFPAWWKDLSRKEAAVAHLLTEVVQDADLYASAVPWASLPGNDPCDGALVRQGPTKNVYESAWVIWIPPDSRITLADVHREYKITERGPVAHLDQSRVAHPIVAAQVHDVHTACDFKESFEQITNRVDTGDTFTLAVHEDLVGEFLVTHSYCTRVVKLRDDDSLMPVYDARHHLICVLLVTTLDYDDGGYTTPAQAMREADGAMVRAVEKAIESTP